MSIEKFFGKRLKEIRKNKKLTQSELAEKLEVDEKYISRLETGISTPSFSLLEKISEKLNIDIQDLFVKTHYMSKDEILNDINNKLIKTTDNNLKLIHKIINNIIEN